MTWAGLVWKNLRRRRVRTALTAAGVAIGVGLIVALLSIAAGGRRPQGDEALLGDIAARSLHLAPGDSLRVENRSFPIAGLYHSGDRFEDAGAVLSLRTVQALAQRPGEVTTFGVEAQLGWRPTD